MKQTSIVLIDDNPLLTDAYSQALSEAGFLVHVAYDGNVGLDIIEKKHPDIVLLDLRLHGANGLSVLEAIKHNEATKDILIIVFTMDDSSETERRAMKAGATLFLGKRTCSIEQLVEHISTVASSIVPPPSELSI